ncbi:Ku protein [Streptomyces sp. NPDC007100]|uniref:Ku protein n=1 Tax=Streptomyces sp. NPDC007100 TaxID=3155602 RepID=UPI0033DDDA0B
MDDHGSVAIGKVALRSKETLALVQPMGDMLVLHSLRWPDQIRTPPEWFPTGRSTSAKTSSPRPSS